ncbi:bifunctional phosphopantothenoylcysteine decarboxylase/phosphopantothenate--cysteine ligase CoaBC [Aerococcus urinae]|uniref:Coenzyme A biosynthesis bifunctional protein CoaBC n=1 Tax=Aerococcus urinae TaxID=1376 RepID=A0A0X8FDN9_9LACT|nr:bifunctional phosphopantothenoylcysteine decarboxylase/phosphopantothenate--cysteine ligase CoaBC [Aerococcus urinae]AMB95352.1 DNA/pantothenate metabolism flavoprotein [Aerococcus urinae]MCY3032078.1 bifunctional phosphopantothenoylcysteine decarboxylase/phosphopantothenate--cysteine ligase CoaBC [Aerococcus urinae]MCY3036930.1 bifunctional phosphopantothenoylcysteine decarboxylase/phosphopantothenate--cysteine ligase CoaBC [Aerococcus urinae]MCY3044124.1 bifunctional phosphopantothenoylcys
MLENKQIVVIVTGGIAAYKAPDFVRLLIKSGAEVRVVMTEAAEQFVRPFTFEVLTKYPVLTDQGDYPESIGHIHLADWADLVVVLPATANTLAKASLGLGDNEATATLLAMDCPRIFVPAMNSKMWENLATVNNVNNIRKGGDIVIEPASGFLAEGYEGKGRMPEPIEVLQAIKALVALDKAFNGQVKNILKTSPFKGKKIAVSAGGTQEAIDPVRFIGNHSSGKMGLALAHVALLLGAEVTLVMTPTARDLPHLPAIQTRQVKDARQLYQVMHELNEASDIIIMAAAVSDYRVETPSPEKIKKNKDTDQDHLQINLVENPDILKSLSQEGTFLVGFAAETNHVLDYAKKKLAAKGIDMIVANDVSQQAIGFSSEDNAVTIISQKGAKTLPQADKMMIAAGIFAQIAQELNP